MPNSGDDGAIANEIMLKTIRLSKNIFSLTERLPKAKYRSPKAVSGAPLQTINNSDNIINNKKEYESDIIDTIKLDTERDLNNKERIIMRRKKYEEYLIKNQED